MTHDSKCEQLGGFHGCLCSDRLKAGAQHAPGPWRIAPSVEGHLSIFANCEHRQPNQVEAGAVGACICLVTPLCDETLIDRSNANLIAAAPELLAALEQAVTSMQDSGYSDRHIVVKAARDAIAKAKGETK